MCGNATRKETVSKHVNLELSSVLGMGAVGPVLAVLTATTYSAFRVFLDLPDWAYPFVMMTLSGLAAVFPVVKSQYSKAAKAAMWPLASVVIFASAWTSSTGMSIGEEKISQPSEEAVGARLPSESPMLPVPPRPEIAMMVSTNAYNGAEGRVTRGRFFRRMR